MNNVRVRVFLIALFFLSHSSWASAFNEEAAAEQWGNAFTWLQVGRNLNESGTTALALGCYMEALKQLKEVASHFPGYETKMVSFRIEMLEKDITEMKTGATPADLEIAKQYVDFIGLIERADSERFSAQRDMALATLRLAKKQLDTIIARRPESFAPAVESQTKRLESNIQWLGKLTAPLPVKPKMPRIGDPVGDLPPISVPVARATASAKSLGKGTTEFIRASDLPSSPGLAPNSESLFPQRFSF